MNPVHNLQEAVTAKQGQYTRRKSPFLDLDSINRSPGVSENVFRSCVSLHGGGLDSIFLVLDCLAAGLRGSKFIGTE